MDPTAFNEQDSTALTTEGAEAPHVDVNVSASVETSVVPIQAMSYANYTTVSAPNVHVTTPNVRVTNPYVTSAPVTSAPPVTFHDAHIQDLTSRFVNALLPGVTVPNSSFTVQVSVAPPIVTSVGPGVLYNAPPGGLATTSQIPSFTNPSGVNVPLYTTYVAPVPYQQPTVSQATYGGHPIASSLWNWHTAQPATPVAPVVSMGQFAPGQPQAQLPAQLRPTGVPPIVSQSVGFPGSMQVPNVPLQPGPSIVPGPTSASASLGANTAPSYIYGAPQSQPQFWNGTQAQYNPQVQIPVQPQATVQPSPVSLQRPELPPGINQHHSPKRP